MDKQKPEVPTHKHPTRPIPTKDPNLAPGKYNPINPKKDEPAKPEK